MDVPKLSSAQHKVYEGKIAGCYDLENQTLGSGHFAVVKLARHCFTGEKVAVKVIDKTKLDEVSKAHLFQEVRCMKLVQHPNVVRLYEAIDTQTKLYLVLELGDGGDLYDFIMRHDTGLSENVARTYFMQIVRAISYCHELHVVHRDLKPENVIFFKNKEVVKLTDFGFSNKFLPGQKLETSCGSLAYSAPEILLGDRYDAAAVDIWSLGVILYMLVYGRPPFEEKNDSETLTMIMDCKYELPDNVSLECRKLIKSMLTKDPEGRASLQEIANHPWLTENTSNTKQQPEYLPLVNRQQVSDENHASIIQKMINGNIAKKDEILDALDRNEYNHITATYFLLAERKLRSQQQQQQQQSAQKLNLRKKPDLSLQLVSPTSAAGIQSKTFNSSLLLQPPSIHSPRTPGDTHRRHRKCSIVKEEEGDEDHDSETSSLHRRGSRSEGRINISVHEVLSTEISERLRLDKSSKRPMKVDERKKVEVRTKLFDGISNVKIVGKNENEKFLGHAGMGLRKDLKVASHHKPLFGRKVPELKTTNDEFKQRLSSSSSSNNQNNRLDVSGDNNSKKKSSNSSTEDEDESEDKKKPLKTSYNLNYKYSKQRRDSHDDSSDSQEPTGTSNRILINIEKCATSNANKQSSNDKHENSNKNKSDGVKSKKLDEECEEIDDDQDPQEQDQESKISSECVSNSNNGNSTSKFLSRSSHSKANKNHSNGKVKKNSSRFLSFLREASETRDASNYKSNRKSFSDVEFLKIRNEKADKDICPSENQLQSRKLVGRYLEVTKKICQPISDLFRNVSHSSNLYKASSCNSILRDSIYEQPSQRLREQKICD